MSLPVDILPKFGYRKDPLDSRDVSFVGSDLHSKLAAASLVQASDGVQEHLVPELTPISDQLNLSSCVANAVCDALEILVGVERPSEVVQLSRLLVYWNARSYSSATNRDEGTFIRDAMDSLRRLGVCPETTWPYSVDAVFAQPPIRAYQASLDNKIEAYYRIDGEGKDRADAIELAVRADHPVVFGTSVGADFTRYFRRDDVVWTPPKVAVGQHAMIVVGVRYVGSTRQFRVRNSWGEAWGWAGHCWFDETYLTDAVTEDIWVPTRVPGLVF